MKINDFDTKEKVFIVAEIGNNHEGDFSVAQEMMGKAAEAGADAVKFQKRNINNEKCRSCRLSMGR